MVSNQFSIFVVGTGGFNGPRNSDKGDIYVFKLLWDRSQVWYQEPKPRSNFGISIRADIFFLKPKLFEIFLTFFCWGHKFYKAWNWTEIFKNNQKILNFWQQVWFKEPFYNSKNTPYYLWLDFPFKMWLRYQLRHRPEVSATLGFSIRPKPK